MRGPSVNDERFMEEVEAGRFSVDAQGRIWRHILSNGPAEPQRAEYPAERGYLRVLWNDGRCHCCQARKAVWRYFYGPVTEDVTLQWVIHLATGLPPAMVILSGSLSGQGIRSAKGRRTGQKRRYWRHRSRQKG